MRYSRPHPSASSSKGIFQQLVLSPRDTEKLGRKGTRREWRGELVELPPRSRWGTTLVMVTPLFCLSPMHVRCISFFCPDSIPTGTAGLVFAYSVRVWGRMKGWCTERGEEWRGYVRCSNSEQQGQNWRAGNAEGVHKERDGSRRSRMRILCVYRWRQRLWRAGLFAA